MKGKNARKRKHRSVSVDSMLVAEKLRERRHNYTKWFASLGGPEALAMFHRSAITAAKPIRKGKITAPYNAFTGCLIQEYKNFYIVFVPKYSRDERLKIDRAGIAHLTSQTEGIYNPRVGFIMPKTPKVIGIVQTLSVRWG